jgi:hypothetical protein
MKKYTFLVAASLLHIVVFQSCKKETLPGVAKFENLRNLSDAGKMRIAFNGMTSVEKADFWKYNLKNSMTGLTALQKKLVLDIYNQISPAVYENGTTEYITFTTLLIPAWLKKAELIFSKNKISELCYFLEGEQKEGTAVSSYTLEQAPQSQIALYSESAPNCLCNIGSSYSCKKREITVGTTGATIKETYGSCTYSRSAYICDRDDYGCGFFGAWSCNGNLCSY